MNNQELRLVWSSEQVSKGVEQIAESIIKEFGDAPLVNLIPVLTGGLHFCAALSSELERRAPAKWLIAPVFSMAYVGDGVLSEPKIEFPSGFDLRVDPDSPTIIVDDLLDSGTTLAALSNLLRQKSLHPIKIAVLVERNRKRSGIQHADFSALNADEDDWLVGFGMDSERRYRGLDAIYVRDSG